MPSHTHVNTQTHRTTHTHTHHTHHTTHHTTPHNSPCRELVEADAVGRLGGRLGEYRRARPHGAVVHRSRQLFRRQAGRREAQRHEGGQEGARVAPQPPAGESLVAVLVVKTEGER